MAFISRNPAPRPTWMGANRGANDPWEMQPALQAAAEKQKAINAARILPQGAFQRQAFDATRLPQWNPMGGETQPQYLSRTEASHNRYQDQLADKDRIARLPSQVAIQARQAGTGAAFPGGMNYQKWQQADSAQAMRNFQKNNPQGSSFAAWNQQNNLRQNVAPAVAPRPSPYGNMDINALFSQFMSNLQFPQR